MRKWCNSDLSIYDNTGKWQNLRLQQNLKHEDLFWRLDESGNGKVTQEVKAKHVVVSSMCVVT